MHLKYSSKNVSFHQICTYYASSLSSWSAELLLNKNQKCCTSHRVLTKGILLWDRKRRRRKAQHLARIEPTTSGVLLCRHLFYLYCATIAAFQGMLVLMNSYHPIIGVQVNRWHHCCVQDVWRLHGRHRWRCQAALAQVARDCHSTPAAKKDVCPGQHHWEWWDGLQGPPRLIINLGTIHLQCCSFAIHWHGLNEIFALLQCLHFKLPWDGLGKDRLDRLQKW